MTAPRDGDGWLERLRVMGYEATADSAWQRSRQQLMKPGTMYAERAEQH